MLIDVFHAKPFSVLSFICWGKEAAGFSNLARLIGGLYSLSLLLVKCQLFNESISLFFFFLVTHFKMQPIVANSNQRMLLTDDSQPLPQNLLIL